VDFVSGKNGIAGCVGLPAVALNCLNEKATRVSDNAMSLNRCMHLYIEISKSESFTGFETFRNNNNNNNNRRCNFRRQKCNQKRS